MFAIQRNRLDVNRGRKRVVAEALIYHGAEWEVNFYEPLTSDGANVLGYHEDGTPAVLVNSYGEGTAIYLNCDIYEYDHLRRTVVKASCASWCGRYWFAMQILIPLSVQSMKTDMRSALPRSHTFTLVTRITTGCCLTIVSMTNRSGPRP